MTANKGTSGQPQLVNLDDYDKILSMTDLEVMGAVFVISDIIMEEREVAEPGEPPKMVPYARFSVYDFTSNEWMGDVSTRGVVVNQLKRMVEHGLPVDARIGPVRVKKGGANGRSLYLETASDQAPF